MTERPKVVMVADTYYPKVDGVLRFMEEFMKHAHEFNLKLLVPKFSEVIKFPEIEVEFLPLGKRLEMFTYKSTELSMRTFRKVKSVIQEADVVFIQELGPVGVLAMRYAKKLGKKTVLYVHNTPWEFLQEYFSLRSISRKLMRKFFVSMYNKADLLLIPYLELKQELVDVGVKSKIEVARLGVDVDKFKPTTERALAKQKLGLPNKLVIGYVGRISQEKNTLILLRAFKRLRRGFLLMVGDGNKELVKKFKNSANCRVTGFVSDVEKYLQAMDVFVMPSLTETTSLATLEAMSTGLPVITSKVGFMKSYIVKGHNGMFFPKNSSSMLSLKLDKILDDIEMREKLGINARKTVEFSFAWDRSIQRINQLLLRECG
jgi:glycosyltransferase involved in cell wall biosynthesis